MQQLHEAIIWLNGWLWGPPMLVLLFGTHLFLTVRLRVIQRYTWLAIKLSFSKDEKNQGDVSQFGALTTALAATIGTGNIVGVATAVALGGPGAVLWCWLTGVFGIATKYAEALLAVKYRVQTSDGTMLGGPMYALERGLGQKWLAVIFCICTAIAAFGIGNMVQANSVASLMQESFQISRASTGLVMTALVALVILGGVRWIAVTCEALVPFMAIFYVGGCLLILAMNASHVLPAIQLICSSAFTPQAAGGGFTGASIMMAARYGIARGLFSNESGLGSAPIIAAAARTRNPVRQGPRVFNRNILGHGGRLRHDRHRHRQQRAARPRAVPEHAGRYAHQGCLCPDTLCGADGACRRACDFCVFDHSRLVLLR